MSKTQTDYQIITHPSYAQIKAYRVHSGAPVTMYGSTLRQGHYIILEISESELHRSLNQDWYFDRKPIIQVRMSETQFAQFITSLNCGGGTPCTIERRDMKAVPEPPFIDEASTIKAEFRLKTKEVAGVLADAQAQLIELMKPGAKINKTEIALLKSKIEQAAREIEANLPFVVSQFEEAVEETIGEAKGAIEAYVMHAAARAGLSQSTLINPGEQFVSIEGPAPLAID